MATLAQFILDRLTLAGLTVNDVSRVEFRHPDFDDWGQAGWITIDRAQFIGVATRVDVADVTPDARERLRFHIVTIDGAEDVYAWNNAAGTFESSTPPRIHTLTQGDLTT